MLSIFINRSFFYVSHLVTFSLIGLPLLKGRIGVIPVMAMLVPVWVSSTVLWSEREESYGFLRTLPITDRDIVRIKFTLAALVVLVYFLLTAMATAQFCRGTPHLAYDMALAEIGAVVPLIAAACWSIGIWRFGMGSIIVILSFMFLGLAGTLMLRAGNGRDPWCAAYDLFPVDMLARAPWYCRRPPAPARTARVLRPHAAAVNVKRASEPGS